MGRVKDEFVAAFAEIHADIPASDPAWRFDEDRDEEEDEDGGGNGFGFIAAFAADFPPIIRRSSTTLATRSIARLRRRESGD